MDLFVDKFPPLLIIVLLQERVIEVSIKLWTMLYFFL